MDFIGSIAGSGAANDGAIFRGGEGPLATIVRTGPAAPGGKGLFSWGEEFIKAGDDEQERGWTLQCRQVGDYTSNFIRRSTVDQTGALMFRPSMFRSMGFVCLVVFSLSVVEAADEVKNNDVSADSKKLKGLIIDGQNNHEWKKTTPILKAALESSGMFTMDVATTPQDYNLSKFRPAFKDYDFVLSNFNGSKNTGGAWPEETKRAFEEFVKKGGGFVAVHAADNAFPEWEEYNKMIGVGGWAGRNETSGPYIRLRDGKVTKDTSIGVGGSHGLYHEFVVETRDAEHPIMKGLPVKWMHTGDELYDRLRGPAENVTVLATANAAKNRGGSGEDEPMLMAIDYGKGRVFHTTLGHDETSLKCMGFATILRRGSEWAATGKVTQKVPQNFPTPEKASTWEPALNR